MKTLLFVACLGLVACAHFPPATPSTADCERTDFGVFNRCLKTLPQAGLGLSDPQNRKQYLLFAEKLDQDRTIEGLTDSAAFAALEARLELLNRAPEQASQCARFAERILCY